LSVLVTGGTGFIGRAVVDRLQASGLDARVFSRASGGDIRDARAVRAAAVGCNAVIHLAGHYRGSDEEMWRVHAEGTRTLVENVDEGARVVLVSSTSVYGWSQSWPAGADSPTRPVSAYGRAKEAAEARVLGSARVNGVVGRTTIVYGPGDEVGMVPKLRRYLARGWRWFPGDGRNRVHLTHVDDVVDGLVRLLDGGTGTYLFAGPEPTPIADVIGALATSLGRRPPIFVGSTTGRALRLVPPLRHQVEVLTVDRAFDATRARHDLGWTPTVDTIESLSRAAVGAPMVEVAHEPGPPWREVVEHHDEGLGSVYERFVLSDVIDDAMARTASTSVLHAPAFGMTGVPGLDLSFQAQRGVTVGLLDVVPDRVDAVRKAWAEIGLDEPATSLAPWPSTSEWVELGEPDSWDRVVSFAALWWCENPVEVLRASARWASKGVLCCVPNRNVFWALRSRLWHSDMFRTLRLDVCDPAVLRSLAAEAGLRVEHEWLFDVPPFPDTAVSIKELLPFLFRGDRSEDGDDAWRWSVVPYLRGDDPELPARLGRIGFLEGRLKGPPRRWFAHHRGYLLVPA
jgi:nucleoside-diphosphate-sugar epimerase